MTLWQPPNRLPTHREQPDVGLRRNGVPTGKFTERRQNRAALLKNKTRQPQSVARGALQCGCRMQMASQHGVGGMALRVMAGGKGCRPARVREPATR